MGPITKHFSFLVFFSLFWLFFYWGHKFFPAYLGCAFWAYMCFKVIFYKDPPDDQNDQKKP